MFSHMIKPIKCPFCLTGELQYNSRRTMEAWQHPAIFRLDDIDKLKDGVISDILVFNCLDCEAEERFTLKEIELKFRKKISDLLLTEIARSYTPDPGAMRKIDRTLIYCGRCGGFDGKGSCPLVVYDKCKIKRIPYGF